MNASIDLSCITLIMLTYNRQDYALRGMSYWGRLGVVLHVMDGTDEPISPPVVNCLNSNIHYHHEPVGIYERIQRSLNYIDTPYCALVCDDEFYLPSGLRAAVDLLEHDPSYIACSGRAIEFWEEGGRICGQFGYPKQWRYELSHDTSERRMLYHMANYTPSLTYAVVRSPKWKQAMNIVVKKEFPVFALGEIQFELAIAALGKSKVLDDVYWMRSLENLGIRGTDVSLDADNNFEDWWDDCNRATERDELVDIQTAGINSGFYFASENSVRASFIAYRNWMLPRAALHADVALANKGCSLWDLLSRILRFLVRGLRQKLYKGSLPIDLLEVVAIFDPPASRETIEDIRNINKFLLSWYENRKFS